MILLLSALAWGASPELQVEMAVGPWRTESCSCVDNLHARAGLGVAAPLNERVALELGASFQIAARPFGSGVALRESSAGLRVLTRESAPSLVLGAGLSQSWLRAGGRWGQLGVRARAGVHLRPAGWILEPALEVSGMQGQLPYSTATLSLRVGRVLAPSRR